MKYTMFYSKRSCPSVHGDAPTIMTDLHHLEIFAVDGKLLVVVSEM